MATNKTLICGKRKTHRWGVGLRVGDDPSSKKAGGGGRFSVSSKQDNGFVDSTGFSDVAKVARVPLVLIPLMPTIGGTTTDDMLQVPLIMVEVRLVGGGGLVVCCIDPRRDNIQVGGAAPVLHVFVLLFSTIL